MRAVLISTYELGRQPFGLASPAAWLRGAGVDTTLLDLSRQPLDESAVAGADLVAFYLPMHTATRLAIQTIGRVRAVNADADLCAYGLYAPLNERLLRALGVSTVLGGEFEADLLALARRRGDASRRGAHVADTGQRARVAPARLSFKIPDRAGLPPLEQYARLHLPDGSQHAVAYTEASRGCKHRCRHCPIVPVYGGAFRLVAPDVVLGDVRQQVAAGARHVTFGDPDFFNAVGHARTVVESLARDFPGVTYDVTIKVEHLVRHATELPRLAATGCLFVTSAVESFDDGVLRRLEKGHTSADAVRAVALCRAAGLTLVPTFVAFTPWTTVRAYLEMLDAIEHLELIPQVASIQLAIRLLVPAGSRLLELDDVARLAGPFDPRTLVHPWRHPDPGVDTMQREVESLVSSQPGQDRLGVFERVRDVAGQRAGRPAASGRFAPGRIRGRVEVPWLDEPWYC